jgi:hypothetical protein
MPMPGAAPRSPASSCGRKRAETPSGAPIVNQRAEVEGSKGWAVAMTCLAPARTSATGAPSSIARAVATTPLGVRLLLVEWVLGDLVAWSIQERRELREELWAHRREMAELQLVA